MTTFLAVILAVSLLGLLGVLAVRTRGAGSARLPAPVTVPARSRRRRARR